MNNHTKRYFSGDFTLGILGGGQLGKMLLQETRRYDIRTRVMDASAEAPCRIGCNEFVNKDIADYEAVMQFGASCDVLTIEIENVNVEALQALSEQGVPVFPQPGALQIIRNKVRQKEFYRKQGVPTADFKAVSGRQEVKNLLNEKDWKLPLVWKAATGGYDGRGVQMLKTPADVDSLPETAEGLVEQKIDFSTELAAVVARSSRGEVKVFPTVEMDFHPTANQVEFVFSPSTIPSQLEKEAQELAAGIAEKLNITGLLAVEMFLDKNNNLLVNEVAPRVHNSGHLTIEGNTTSQFDQHLRAILGWPLGDVAIVKPAVMVNLVGDAAHTGPVVYEGMEKILGIKGVFPHIYGKALTRPFRKMGHVTITANTLAEARETAKKVKQSVIVKSNPA